MHRQLLALEAQHKDPRPAYIDYVNRHPGQALAQLFAGTVFHHLQDPDTAFSLLVPLFDRQPELFQLWRDTSVPQAIRQRSQYATMIVRNGFTELHQSVLAQHPDANLTKCAIWTRTHNQKFQFTHPRCQPQLFYLPGVRQQGLWQQSLFNNDAQAVATIQTEINQNIDLLAQHAREYLGQTTDYTEDFRPLQQDDNWTAIDLYKDGNAHSEVLTTLPKTHALLQQCATYCLGDYPEEVFISTLKPHQIIPPHYGLSNHSLTVHIPLVIPDGCFFNVDQQRQPWSTSQPLIFDDSFVHSAENNSAQTRRVLIFSIWHPDLNSAERRAIKASFSARKTWVEHWYQQNEQLLKPTEQKN